MLIVPPGVNLRGETIDLLDDYVSGGGALAFAGAVPYLVDGLPSEKLERIVQNYGLLLPSRSDLNDYRPIIDYMQARKIVPKRDAESLPKPRVCRRSAEEAELYLAFNDRNETRELAFDATSPFDGHVERWDARTGEMVGVAPCAKDEPVAIVDTWRPYEARMYVAVETAFRESSDATATERVAGPTPLWTVSRTSPNALEFSHCSLSDDDSRTLDETRALLADAIADAGRPVVWRTHWTFEFEPATKSTASCSLLIPDVNMEDPDRTVCLDGEPLEEADRRFYRGRPYRAYALPDPASGEHEITWQSFIGVASEFQSPVVMGEIAVRSPGSEVPAIAPAGKKLDFGLWSDFGLWCYGGPVVYRGTCTVLELPKTERVILEVPELSGVAHVKVNANAAGGLVFQPRTLDVTRFVKRGENVIEIAVAPPPGACGGAFGLAIAPVLHVERRRESE